MRPADARCAHLMRRLALDHNELRRPSDRIEGWCALALIIAFVPLAVLSAAFAAGWVHASAVREQRANPVRQVTAVLVHDVPAAKGAMPGTVEFLASARWTFAGSSHVGDVPAIPGSRAGTAVRIWVDAAGNSQGPPLTAGQVTARIVLVVVAVPLGVALCLRLAWCALRRLLDRRRLASWAREWSSLGPSWRR
jgi:hypothetical protein